MALRDVFSTATAYLARSDLPSRRRALILALHPLGPFASAAIPPPPLGPLRCALSCLTSLSQLSRCILFSTLLFPAQVSSALPPVAALFPYPACSSLAFPPRPAGPHVVPLTSRLFRASSLSPVLLGTGSSFPVPGMYFVFSGRPGSLVNLPVSSLFTSLRASCAFRSAPVTPWQHLFFTPSVFACRLNCPLQPSPSRRQSPPVSPQMRHS